MILLQANISRNQHSSLWEQHYASFPPDFQEKVSRYRRWQDAQAAILGRILLQKGLAEHFDYSLDLSDLQYGPKGKPFLADSELQFNISHTHGKVICALQAGAAVGVDIEYVTPTVIDDFRFQMTDNEWAIVTNASDQQRAFYDYWTSKEAILKVEGSGLSLGLKTFEVDESRHWAIVRGKKWYLKRLDVGPNHIAYVASAQPIQEVSLFHI